MSHFEDRSILALRYLTPDVVLVIEMFKEANKLCVGFDACFSCEVQAGEAWLPS